MPARALLKDGALRIEEQEGAFLSEAPLTEFQISPRLGKLPRRFALPDGACFETGDNDAADLLLGNNVQKRRLLQIDCQRFLQRAVEY